jgi:phage terminase large subunit-like protein
LGLGMNIIDALTRKGIFAPLFREPVTWRSWAVYLQALFGLGIDDAKDRRLFRECTGLAKPPAEAVRESFVICGRRSGKSYISAIIASFLAAFRDWRPYLSPGERGWIFVIANDKAQAGIIKAYISGIFHRVACLRTLIEKETVETLELRNDVNIAVKTASFRSLRGYTILCAILEEIAFWRSEESANPDRETVAAVRPALATIPESLLIGI